MPQSLRKRRWFQFSLLGLLGLTTAASLAVGWWRMPFEVEVPPDGPWCPMGADPDEDPMAGWRATCMVQRTWNGEPVRHGVNLQWNPDGRLYFRRHWRHGVLDGPAEFFDPNSDSVERGNFRNGKRHGEWITICDYVGLDVLGIDLGRVHRTVEVYDDGELLEITEFGKHATTVRHYGKPDVITQEVFNTAGVKLEEFDARHGRAAGWHANGRRRYVGEWLDGCEHGSWTWWDAEGHETLHAEFDHGAPLRRTGNGARVRIPLPGDIDADVLRALHESTQCDFYEVPLEAVLDFLMDFHGITIAIDDAALQAAGRSADDLLTHIGESNDGTAIDHLRRMLERHGLTFVVRGPDLVVTTPAAAAAMPGIVSHHRIPSERLMWRLRERVSVRARDQPLREVLNQLCAPDGIVWGATPAVNATGALEQPDRFEISSISRRAALALLLDRSGLQSHVEDDVLVIEERAATDP